MANSGINTVISPESPVGIAMAIATALRTMYSYSRIGKPESWKSWLTASALACASNTILSRWKKDLSVMSIWTQRNLANPNLTDEVYRQGCG